MRLFRYWFREGMKIITKQNAIFFVLYINSSTFSFIHPYLWRIDFTAMIVIIFKLLFYIYLRLVAYFVLFAAGSHSCREIELKYYFPTQNVWEQDAEENIWN